MSKDRPWFLWDVDVTDAVFRERLRHPCDAALVPTYVSGHCTTYESPEEPVQARPIGPGSCFVDP